MTDVRYVTPEENEHCQDCGRAYALVWKAPDALWHKLMGSEAGLRCPDCFDKWAAVERGISLEWECHVVEKETQP